MAHVLKKGLRLCVVLEPGDLLLMSGHFQKHCAHKTKKFIDIDVERLSRRYPAMTADTIAQILLRPSFMPRGVFTWRRIENHKSTCPCLLSKETDEMNSLYELLQEALVYLSTIRFFAFSCYIRRAICSQ